MFLRTFFMLFALIIMMLVIAIMMPYKTTESLVGSLQDIQLHSTLFSTKSTLRTTGGIFQVKGAVSASVGAAVKIKKREVAGDIFLGKIFASSELCIDASSLEARCYQFIY